MLLHFFTIYYARNLDILFRNVNYTLKPNGLFFAHVINKKNSIHSQFRKKLQI